MLIRHPARDFGRGAPIVSSYPAWRQGATPFQWASIAGTTGPGALADYSGVGWRDDNTGIEAGSIAPGGHGGNLTNNRCDAIQLMDDAPAWRNLAAAGNSTGWNTNGSVPYLTDGTPAPRHEYWYTQWAGGVINRYMLFGYLGMGSGANQGSKLDGFNPATGLWDAAGTFSDLINSFDRMTTFDPATGVLYGAWNGVAKFDPRTSPPTRSSIGSSGSGPQPTRYASWDSANNDLFFVNVSDNWAGGATPAFGAISTAGVLSGAYTANASAGYTDLVAAAASVNWAYASLTYDPDLGGFWYYAGLSDAFAGVANAAAKIYFIKRNVGPKTVDVTLRSVTGVPAHSLGSGQGGVMNKLYYASRLKCLLLIIGGGNVHFLPTA